MSIGTEAVSLSKTWLVDYARRPLNVALVILVPVVLVSLTAGTLAEFARLLGGSAGTGSEAVTAVWAAAVLSGVAGFFQVSGSRTPDRRLAAARGRASGVVASRVFSTLAISALAIVGALLALRLRFDAAWTPHVVAATVVAALTYAGLGVLVGALVRSEFNGSLIMVFLWIFDVFFGPAMGIEATVTRILPLHFPTRIATDGLSGSPNAVQFSVMWAALALAAAGFALAATTRQNRLSGPRSVGVGARLWAGLAAAFRELRRMPSLWVLVAGLPVLFISASIAITPADPTPVKLTEGSRVLTELIPMSEVHGAIMVPITVAILAALAGLFVVLDAAEADRRLSLTRFTSGEILTVRMAAVLVASMVATAVSIAVTAVSFSPRGWLMFIVANLMVAVTYALIGAIVGPLLGRLGGLYVLLILPFLDLGVAQNPMFDAAPPGWAVLLPGFGAVRVMNDAAFTASFDDWFGLWLALAWLAAIGVVAWFAFRKVAVRVRATPVG